MGIKISELTELETANDNDVIPIVDTQNAGTKKISFSTIKKEILKIAFPVGSTYVTQSNTNPNSVLGFGIWERLKGKVCLGLDEDDGDLDTIGKTGGEKKHTLTINEMPSHNHGGINDANVADGPTDGTYGYKSNGSNNNYTGNTGGDQPHNNMQPYEVTGYMWIRRS